jgi:hypothetical protein
MAFGHNVSHQNGPGFSGEKRPMRRILPPQSGQTMMSPLQLFSPSGLALPRASAPSAPSEVNPQLGSPSKSLTTDNLDPDPANGVRNRLPVKPKGLPFASPKTYLKVD